MKRKDVSDEVTHKLADILEACKRIEKIVEPYLVTTDEKPDIWEDLVTLLNNADDLVELAMPTPDPGELFGLPKSALTGSEQKLFASHIDREGWDFIPWFYQKISSMKKHVKDFTHWWQMSPTDLKRLPRSYNTREEYLKEGIDAALYNTRAYATTVFEEVCKCKLELEIIED